MILDVMFPSGEYVLPCVTPSVVSRGRAPNVARGKMQKKKERENVPCFDRGLVHNVSSPGLEAPPRDHNPCVVDCLSVNLKGLTLVHKQATAPERPLVHFSFFPPCVLSRKRCQN